MNNLFYLAAAYLLLWLVLLGYVFNLMKKQKSLNQDVERLKMLIEEKNKVKTK